MLATILIGAALGGVVAWLWSAISWMALPWHHATFLAFRDEDAVAKVIEENIAADGVYGLPAPPRRPPGASKAERDAIDQRVFERMQRGPVALMVIQAKMRGPVGKLMSIALLCYAIVAGLLTWCLLQTSGLAYFQRAEWVAVAALAGAAFCRLSDWNWHGYSARYTLVALADTAIGWFLVGLVLAKVVAR